MRKNLTAMWGQGGARPEPRRFRVPLSNIEDREENAGSIELMELTASSFFSQNQHFTILFKMSSGEVSKNQIY